MLTSMALMLLLGLTLGSLFRKLKLPSLLGYMITGIVLSPYALDLIDSSILAIAADLRQIALVVILTRAGLSLDLADLKKVGRPAVLMCFLPAAAEMLGVILLAPCLFDISYLDAAIMASVLAAVSPAVVVPRMIRLINEGYGKEHSIPQLILAGASVDDVFVIVVFTALTALASTGKKIGAASFLQVPVSIITGILFGWLCGVLLVWFFHKVHIRDTEKLLILLSGSFLMIQLQSTLEGYVPFSGLLAIMSMGIVINRNYHKLAVRLQAKYNKLWVAAEVLLFVLVGASVDLSYAVSAGLAALLLIVGALVFRMAGVACCLIRTPLTAKERLFCMIAYTPKATVQAGIGAVPLAMGLTCGPIVLTMAVLAILITAPFGAIGVDCSYRKLLKQKEHEERTNK